MRYVAETPRAELRLAIRAGWSMDRAEHFHRLALFSDAAMQRFARLWAWSTATDHPMTRSVPLNRWMNRRARIRRAVCAFLSTPQL